MDSKQKWRENNPNYQKEYYERNKEWINQKKKECRFRKKEELNIPLQFQNGKVEDNSPSLDKIIPELGYVKNNVWVVSIRANRLKSDSSYDELLLLVTNLRKKINAKE